VKEFLALSASSPLSPVLSLTCGTAEDEIFLAQNGLSVYVIDNDAQKLEQVRLKMAIYKIDNLKVLQADILKPLPLPFRPHTFNSLYWKFGLHYFSEGQIKQTIIPEMVRALNPDSVVSIIFRYIDVSNVDCSKFEIVGHTGHKVQFLGKSTGKVRTRYIWDEAAAKGLFADNFDVISLVTQREELYERFSNSNNSPVVSLLLKAR
jgi:Methylase involved in ubiquinone/menaquinone biosynthesis